MVRIAAPLSKIAVHNNTNHRCFLTWGLPAIAGSGAEQFVKVINQLQSVNGLIVNPHIGPGVTFKTQSLSRALTTDELGLLSDQLNHIATHNHGYHTVDGNSTFTTENLTLGLPKQCRLIALKATQANSDTWDVSIAYGSMTMWSGNTAGSTRTYNVTDCPNIG